MRVILIILALASYGSCFGFSDITNAASSAINSAWSSVVDSSTSAVRSVRDGVVNQATSTLNQMKDQTMGVINTATGTISNAMNSALDNAQKLGQNILDKVQSITK